jgi:hypothetical protein
MGGGGLICWNVMNGSRLRLVAGLGVLLVVSFATVLPLCGVMFRCGCSIRHGERECNVHVSGVPHCPWCEGGAKAFLPGYALAMAAAGATLAAVMGRRRKASGWVGVAAAVGVYLLVVSLAALVTAKVMHYPYWFGIRVG